MKDAITEFDGEWEFLSNFYLTEVEYMGVVWPSSEHAYVAAKTLDPEIRAKVLEIVKPGAAKRFGHTFPLRSDWALVKIKIMAEILESKFSNPELMKRLQSTGNRVLKEGNKHGDTFWGIDANSGIGQNWLGILLMRLRDHYRLFAD